jgi:hypothetical protein
VHRPQYRVVDLDEARPPSTGAGPERPGRPPWLISIASALAVCGLLLAVIVL